MKRLLFIPLLLLAFSSYSQVLRTNAFYTSVAVADAPSTLLNGLLSAYELDESSGDAIDEVGSIDGDVTGATQHVAGGVIGYCYSFDGDGDWINLGDNFEFADSFSIALWALNDNTDADMFMMANSANYLGWVLDFMLTNDRAHGSLFVSGPDASITGTTDISDGINFYHIVLTYDKQHFRLYVNGASNATEVDYTSTITYDPTSIAYIGGEEFLWFDGKIDLVRLWNRGLTANEVLELYTKEDAGTTYPW